MRLFTLIFAHLYFIRAEMIPSVEDYFPELGGNLTMIEWLHAVNSKARLSSGLADKSIHILEADVIMGKLEDGSGPMPVMGHPPAHVSDLSLEQFIVDVIAAQGYTKKGMKLDFKSDIAYNASWAVINQLKNKFTFPVWLNADILKGPVHPSSVPLNPRNFVHKAGENLPSAPLSLGWTTAFENGASFTSAMLNDMRNVVKDEAVMQPVTLAVRAAFAALSADGLVQLVEDIDRYQNRNQTTLTVWMSDLKDIVDIEKLRVLMARLGTKKVALDVPKNIRDQLIS